MSPDQALTLARAGDDARSRARNTADARGQGDAWAELKAMLAEHAC